MSPAHRNKATGNTLTAPSTSHAPEPLLRIKQLAAAINVPPRTLARWTAEKRIASLKIGASRFYQASRVLDCLKNFEERPGK
jgi:hypothetical protein